MDLLWIILAGVYIAMFAVLGIMTLKKGHTVLFIVGIFFPLLWIVGAVMSPSRNAPPAPRPG